MPALTTFSRPLQLPELVQVPGDKSLSHRALLLAGLATGHTQLLGLGTGQDVQATARCLQQLGVEIKLLPTVAEVHSPGFAHWQQPEAVLDCGNSGTTMRLLLGILAAHPHIHAILDGDASLRLRPMARVVTPLQAMGAQIQAKNGKPPLEIHGQRLRGAEHRLEVASAQVKSALLLAGLLADGQTVVQEPLPSRDHTERLLRALGVELQTEGLTHSLTGQGPLLQVPTLGQWQIPGDPSAAAFALVAGILHPSGQMQVPQVLTNPGRLGFVQVLERMGAPIARTDTQVLHGEPQATLRSHHCHLQPTDIAAAEVPSLIDELPILALAASVATGISHFAGIGELKVKESDRLEMIVKLLTLLGIHTEHGPDWLTIHGAGSVQNWQKLEHPWQPGLDHRMAMTAAIAGLCGPHALVVENFQQAAQSSWPDFLLALR